MSTALIQFNSGEHSLGDKNIAEAVSSSGDIAFNESYIVVGELLEGAHIYATYDLRVLSDMKATEITVNGNLFVDGNIEAGSLICRGVFICTGNVKVEKIELGSFAVAEALRSEELSASGNLFVHSTIDTNSSLEAEGLVVAGEGIMGAGCFKARATIANEYFEFSGRTDSSVYEISSMDFVSVPEKGTYTEEQKNPSGEIDIAGFIECFDKTLNKSIVEWSKLEESDLIKEIHATTESIQDLHAIDSVLNRIAELSYEREITNFRDLLFILFARHVFPSELAQYETFEPVVKGMFDVALKKLYELPFKASGITDFAQSLYILSKYYEELPICLSDSADKIFSSIGIKYSTVEHVWRDCNE